MKKLSILLFLFFTFLNVQAQILDPVKWTTKVEKVSETEFLLVMNAIIDEGWHMYSQFTPADGPLAMEFVYKEAKGNFNLNGKTKESKYEKAYNDVFEVDEYFFSGKAQFSQLVKITNPNLKSIKVEVDYQVCKQSCINQNKSFEFKLPVIKTDEFVTVTVDSSSTPIDTSKVETKTEEKNPETPIKEKDEKGLWTIFFLAFLGGLAALLTPCVFPMIPMTVSFFTKHSGSRQKGIANALFYGFSIIVIYVALGLLITGIFGADALNALSTSVIFNLIFFVILVFFAISFLGGFEIVLPNSWANLVDKKSSKSGVIGIFFMALALAIVSFSCTGPIVGTLLVESASKGGIAPIIGMLGFSSAIAFPFMLFALFPAWMNSLPKSGGWLNTVKVSLGFLELAFAFKFLSNADLVLQLHLLEREVFLAIWIAVFGAWAMYLFGKITLPHDSPLNHISVGRLLLALLVSTFTIYMIPGLFGAPLKIISAFPPPQTYSESSKGIGFSNVNSNIEKLPEDAEIGPNGIIIFTDYDKGLAYAKTINKPALLDFTGHACVNCRKMENNVWSDEKVLKILKNDVVVISLFADDKRDLPKKEQFVSKETGSIIETIGDKWTDFMITKYKTNTQPLYVLIDSDGNNLNLTTPTISYEPNIKEYETWLKEGLSKFKK